MDKKTRLLIALGASTAANCIPCFEHYYGTADGVGLGNDEIQEAVDIAIQVRNGAQTTIKSFIKDTLGKEPESAEPCCSEGTSSCCQ